MQSFSSKQYTQVDLVLAFINLYTQQSKSYFAGYQKYWIMRERQSICCCKTHNLGHKTGVEKKIKAKEAREGVEVCTRDTSLPWHGHWKMTRKKRQNIIPVTAGDGPGRFREKKLKALGLTKNAPRERVRSLVCPVRSFAKIYPPIITCPPSSLPQIPLQTTEVVKRPKISASLACTRLHCACAAMLNSPSISELAALISTESPLPLSMSKKA